MYLFTNLSSANTCSVKIVDPCLKRLFNVKLVGEKNKWSSARINYSIASFQNKVFLYGGLDENSKVLNTMDIFDACTYKITAQKFRGDYTPKGRQLHSAICLDRFTMVIIGGTF